jgi:hypothetical protein
MTRNELIAELQTLGIPSDSYCFDGLGAGECYCAELVGTKWLCFYSERGQRQGVHYFDSEEEAYEYLLITLRRIFKKSLPSGS